MPTRLRWAILGTGNIAGQFAADLAGSSLGVLAAVGSRSRDAADRFTRTLRAPAAHDDYQSAVTNPAVDAVYVALPNTLHHHWTIAALRAGKHVLCEKPIASNEEEAREMFDEAARAGRLLVEAFMYRSHPLTRTYLAMVRDGAIGQVRMLRSSFCYCSKKPQGNIRFDPALAGGALMDVGCYCIDWSKLIAGSAPSALHAVARLHTGGVDEVTTGALVFDDPGGAKTVAGFSCGMTVHADNTAMICGSEGYIEIPVPWKPPLREAQFTIARSTPPKQDGAKADAPPRQQFTVNATAPLFAMEADDFAAAAARDRPPAVSPEESLTTMSALDTLRKQVGVKIE